MGKTTTPKYAMTMQCARIRASESCWRGRATEKRLREYLVAYNESLKPGGANARIAEVFGYDQAQAVSGAIIRNDGTREIIVTVTL